MLELNIRVFFCCFFFQIGDSGEYRCVAESEAGAAERTISLKVQGSRFIKACVVYHVYYHN